MTDGIGSSPGDRLDRIEALLATVAESNAASSQRMDRIEAGLERTWQICQSNARSVAAWENRIEESIAETEEIATQTRQDLSERIDSQSERIDRTEQQVEDDWTRSDQRHEEHTRRFNTLLEEARADRIEWRRRFDEQQKEANKRFGEVLSQIQQIWQRLAS
jgi:exonuclease VII large subunit